MMVLERRFLSDEVRLDEVEGERRIVGYGAVFNALSEDLGGFRELVLPGAFSRAAQKDDVRALFNHNPSLILGRNRAGTLRLTEDERGLHYIIVPPETQYARDLIVSLERGDVDRSSFGFEVLEESWRSPTEAQPYPVRILHEVRLYDVSPVTFPAYPQTSAEAREKAREIGGQAAPNKPTDTARGRVGVLRRKVELATYKRYEL